MKKISKTYGLQSLMRRYPTSASALSFFAEHFWGKNGAKPICPRPGCKGNGSGLTPQAKPHHYWCGLCRKYFNPLTCTPLQGTRLDLRKVIHAAYLLLSSRFGVSGLQLSVHIHTQYETALYLLTRLRTACGASMFNITLEGVVESDEVFIGRSDSSRHISKELGFSSQSPVLTLVQRGEKGIAAVRLLSLEDKSKRTIERLLVRHIHTPAVLNTDDSPTYDWIGLGFQHKTVNHSAGQYVNGTASTNMAESVHAVIKRGWKGTYTWWSRKYMPLYLHEFAFRLTLGKCSIDIDRRLAMLFGGMRLADAISLREFRQATTLA